MSKSVQIVNYSESDIVDKIYILRSQRVMPARPAGGLDRDLDEMYDVETKVLNQAVKMFQISLEELKATRSQIVTLKKGRGSNIKYFPFAFTEQGVAMLSSVLRSERAIQVNIQIIRVYTRMKQILFDNKDLWLKMEKIEQSLIKKDEEVKAIFKILQKLLVQKEKPRNKIGFLAGRDKQNK